MIPDAQPHGDRGLNLKQHGKFRPKTKILRSLPDIERDRRLPFTGFRAVDHRDRILDSQTA